LKIYNNVSVTALAKEMNSENESRGNSGKIKMKKLIFSVEVGVLTSFNFATFGMIYNL
jgi:hypothetical protein